MRILKKSMCRHLFMVFCFFFLSVIEMFFVIAPLTESYTPLVLLQLIAVLSMGCCWFMGIKNEVRVDRFVLLLFFFLAYMTISAFVCGSSRFSADMFFFWSSFLLIVLCGNMKKYKIEDFLLKMFVFFGIFFSVGVFLQMMFTETFENNYFSMFKGEYKDSVYRQVIYNQMYTGWTSQTFATCVNLAAAIFASWLLWQKKHSKIWLITLAVNVLAMLLTGKRGPVVFMLASLLLVDLVITKKFSEKIKKIWKYILGAAVVGIAVVIYITAGSNSSRNTIVRFMEMFEGGSDDVSNGRFTLWKLAVELFADNPIFGIGWRIYPTHSVAYEGNEMYTHNVVLQVLCEMGLVGLMLYLSFIIYALVDTYKLIKKNNNRITGDGIYLLKLSLMIQCFWLLYSLTGNVLYDYNAILIYFFAVMMYIYAKNTIYMTGEELYEKICNVYARRK